MVGGWLVGCGWVDSVGWGCCGVGSGVWLGVVGLVVVVEDVRGWGVGCGCGGCGVMSAELGKSAEVTEGG